MIFYDEETIQLIDYGIQDCSDLHSWGPGMRSCYIIHYIISGEGYVECQGHRFHLSAGQSFLLLPYVLFHYYPDKDNPWVYTWVNFIGKEAGRYLQDICMDIDHPVSPVIPSSELLPLFERLGKLDLYHQNKSQANGILLAILGIYGDASPASLPAFQKEVDPRAATAILLIHSNFYKTDFNVDMLCQMMNINRVTLYRLFKKQYNLSPGNYLTQYRLAQALKMLHMGVSVKSTSISCGFTDQFYFSKSFKQYFGINPSQVKSTTASLL